MIRLLALLALLFCASVLPAQDTPVEEKRPLLGGTKTLVTLTPEKSKVEIGERVPVRVIIADEATPKSITLTLPKEQSTLAFLEPVEFDGKEYKSAIRILKDGPQIIGPVKISLKYADDTTADSDSAPLAFDVAAITVPEGTARDLTSPAVVPFDWTFRNLAIVGALIAIIVALALLAWWLSRRKKPEAIAATVPLLPPLDEARLALDKLKTMDLFSRLGPEQHYTALSMLLRRYLEREFRVSALEMTEVEVTNFIRHDLSMKTGAVALAEVFTRSSDAKFAKMELSRDIAEADCAIGNRFLDAEEQRIARERAAARAAQPRGGNEAAA